MVVERKSCQHEPRTQGSQFISLSYHYFLLCCFHRKSPLIEGTFMAFICCTHGQDSKIVSESRTTLSHQSHTTCYLKGHFPCGRKFGMMLSETPLQERYTQTSWNKRESLQREILFCIRLGNQIWCVLGTGLLCVHLASQEPVTTDGGCQ